MLFIKDIKPSLNTQSDSIRAKLFTWHFRFFFFFYFLFFIVRFALLFCIIPIGHTNIFIVSRFIYSCSNFYRLDLITGSLSNHDHDVNKNPTNLHIWQWKTVFLHALYVHFLTFLRRSRSFYDVKWPVLQLCGRRQHMMTNVQFCLLMP